MLGSVCGVPSRSVSRYAGTYVVLLRHYGHSRMVCDLGGVMHSLNPIRSHAVDVVQIAIVIKL